MGRRALALFCSVLLLTAYLLPIPTGAQEQASSPDPSASPVPAASPEGAKPFVAVIDMDMMILPGTQAYLEHSIDRAAVEGAKMLVVILNTPGGVLNTTQEMVQAIFSSPVPVAVYVGPSGATSASAGVFITLAAHVAAMAPGTSLGAAHPVTGTGADIEGDMRKKAENITVAMMKSISDQRGRNAKWAEESVKESSSLTPHEALKNNVIDFISSDLNQLLSQIKGKKVMIGTRELVLDDYSKLPRVRYEMVFKNKLINVLGNPNIAALLWLAATTGLTLELYHPGAVLPGVVGLICLLLALGVSQIVPISSMGIMLIAAGALLIVTELYVASGILGLGGVVAMAFGMIYLVDESMAPGISVTLWLIIPVIILLAAGLFYLVGQLLRSFTRKASTGEEGIIGAKGRAVESISDQGRVLVQGTYWRAVRAAGSKSIEKDDVVVVVACKGLVLEVKKADADDSLVAHIPED